MSAVPRHPHPTAYAGLRMTADEYLSLGETPEHYELIDGVVVMSPSATPSHNEIINEIVYQLKAFAREAGIRVFTDTDLRVGPDLVYRPDLAAYHPARLAARPLTLDTPPELAVEVLSPSSRGLDLVTKRRDYDRFGVGEYWIIDPDSRQVRALQRPAAGLPFIESLVAGEALVSRAVPGFALDLRPILDIIDAAGRTPPDQS